MTNAELANLIKQGDENALSVFMNRHYSWVYNLAHKMLKNHHDAEEAVSDVFIKLWRVIDKHDPSRNNFLSWFNRFVRNALIDAWRGRNREVQRFASLHADEELAVKNEVPDETLNPLSQILADEMLRELENTVCQMPSETLTQRKERLAWCLFHFEGYPQKQIAKIMDAQYSSVKVWVHRFTRRLQQELRYAVCS